MNCKKCGSLIDQQASNCPICGEAVEVVAEQPVQNTYFNAEQQPITIAQPVAIKKKKNLKLIIGVAIIFVILTIVTIIAIKTFGGASGSESTKKAEATINNLIAGNDKYIISNFVNTNDMYRLKYPSQKTITGLMASTFGFSTIGTGFDIGDYTEGAYYQMSDISFKKFNIADYSNGKDLYEKFLSQLMKNGTEATTKYSPDTTYVKSLTIGGIEWSKYSGKLYNLDNTTEDGQTWVAISHSVPLVFNIKTYSYEDGCGHANESDIYTTCKSFVDKRDDLVRYVLGSIEFIDDKEVLLNTFENSALADRYTAALKQKYTVENYNYLSTTIYNPVYSIVYKNTDKISIESVYDKIKDDLYGQMGNGMNDLVMTTGNTYNMSNVKVGDYTVKNYTFARDSRKPSLYIYTFIIGDYYGYIGSLTSDMDDAGKERVDDILGKYENSRSVDRAIKNFYWSKDSWSLKDI